MPESVTPEVRNLRFETGAAVPRYWHGDRRAVTDFFNNLSILFPAGERFFIASVRAFRDRVQDPRLAEQVRAFTAQEGVHRREHVRYNAMLQAQGLPADALDAGVERILERVARIASRRQQLAATCALEHFTALLAQAVLSDPTLLEGADPEMAALWRWHAAEENEHKAVAYDVYLAAGGNWRERVVVMAVATVIFWARVLQQQGHLMHADGTLWSVGEWSALFRYLFVNPGGLRKLFLPYLAWYRPDFHPNDLDTDALLNAWREEFRTSPIYQRAG